jgi:hypothetical protein
LSHSYKISLQFLGKIRRKKSSWVSRPKAFELSALQQQLGLFNSGLKGPRVEKP